MHRDDIWLVAEQTVSLNRGSPSESADIYHLQVSLVSYDSLCSAQTTKLYPNASVYGHLFSDVAQKY